MQAMTYLFYAAATYLLGMIAGSTTSTVLPYAVGAIGGLIFLAAAGVSVAFHGVSPTPRN